MVRESRCRHDIGQTPGHRPHPGRPYLGPPETRCFLAQQGAEKYLKGYLSWHGVPFRKVHDLLEILNACRSVDDGFRALEADCRALNPYSVQARYPGYLLDCVEEDANDALTRAGRMLGFVRGRLGLEG
ncbi:MAG: HEPN domain-containing protein [Chloroflexota bacterium]